MEPLVNQQTAINSEEETSVQQKRSITLFDFRFIKTLRKKWRTKQNVFGDNFF